jgi:hypothetical protein
MASNVIMVQAFSKLDNVSRRCTSSSSTSHLYHIQKDALREAFKAPQQNKDISNSAIGLDSQDVKLENSAICTIILAQPCLRAREMSGQSRFYASCLHAT